MTDTEKLQLLAEDGASATEAAEALGVSRTTVQRRAEKAGITFADGRKTPSTRDLVDYRAIAQTMPPHRARDYLLEILDYLVPTSEHVHETDGLELTPYLARVFHVLRMRQGQLVTCDTLMAALYGDRRDGDWPDDTTARVHVSRLRRELEIQDAPWRIVNVRSLGYRLIPRTTASTRSAKVTATV